ncbi:Uncharacterized protein Fot_03507 [Forsythia ovata]|uniref:Uncharacterized protein n=1 Tax=Forsythia ovata TaxID=205694 RepID=A0ABD1XD07_9LAMI
MPRAREIPFLSFFFHLHDTTQGTSKHKNADPMNLFPPRTISSYEHNVQCNVFLCVDKPFFTSWRELQLKENGEIIGERTNDNLSSKRRGSESFTSLTQVARDMRNPLWMISPIGATHH